MRGPFERSVAGSPYLVRVWWRCTHCGYDVGPYPSKERARKSGLIRVIGDEELCCNCWHLPACRKRGN
jgi:hypothetical protein